MEDLYPNTPSCCWQGTWVDFQQFAPKIQARHPLIESSLCIGEVGLNTWIPHSNMWHFPSRERENDKPTKRSFTIKVFNLTWFRLLALSKSKLFSISHTSSCGFKVRHQTEKKTWKAPASKSFHTLVESQPRCRLGAPRQIRTTS